MKYLVTSALPYVNNIPHLGNLVVQINTDVYTRYLRLIKKEVISVLGTDEHGTTTEVVALKEGKTPKQVVDYYYKIHKEVYEWFNCEFDCFGRTSDIENHELTQELFLDLYNNGFILEQEIEQFFDESAQKFLSDRFIEGTCPHCKYEEARGDQCDNCQKLLNPTELINPISKLTKKTPIIKKTKHLFLDLEKLQPELEELTKNQENWSENTITTTKAWFKEGLKPRAITRDLNWGIKVPLKGYENKVFYVWFDAPIGYISITKKCRNDWKDWWFSKDTKLIQFLGKDNIPFHSILFPAILIGSKKPYTIVNTIRANEYLNYEDKKFSKSRGIGIFGDNAKDTGIPADCFRYYTIINNPEKTDSTFTWDDFTSKINNEIIANYVNLISRVSAFIKKFYDYKIPDIEYESLFEEDITKIKDLYDSIELKRALKETMLLSKKANNYFQSNEPWKLIKENKEECDKIISSLSYLIVKITILLNPVMPKLTKEVLNLYNVKEYNLNKLDFKLNKINEPRTLLEKVDEKRLAKLKTMFDKPKKKIDLTVGKIIEIKDHLKADKLYIEKIDIGDGKTKQIISGLKDYYKKEELLGKKVIIVNNLKPAKLRGELSEGMLLAVSSEKEVGVLTTDLEVGKKILDETSEEISIEEFFSIRFEYKKGELLKDHKRVENSKNIKVDKNLEGIVK